MPIIDDSNGSAPMRISFLIGFVFLTSMTSVGAQEYANPYQKNLYTLAGQLGALHFLRGQCERDERTVWRDTMKELIRQENPSRRQARTMTEHFNTGYKEARDSFPDCSYEGSQEARSRANEAVLLTEAISEALE